MFRCWQEAVGAMTGHFGIPGGFLLPVLPARLVAGLMGAGDFSRHPPDSQKGRIEAEVDAAFWKRGKFGGFLRAGGLLVGGPLSQRWLSVLSKDLIRDDTLEIGLLLLLRPETGTSSRLWAGVSGELLLGYFSSP